MFSLSLATCWSSPQFGIHRNLGALQIFLSVKSSTLSRFGINNSNQISLSVSLAVADFLVGIAVLPFSATWEVYKVRAGENSTWILQDETLLPVRDNFQFFFSLYNFVHSKANFIILRFLGISDQKFPHALILLFGFRKPRKQGSFFPFFHDKLFGKRTSALFFLIAKKGFDTIIDKIKLQRRLYLE